jgi:hypothetical protein
MGIEYSKQTVASADAVELSRVGSLAIIKGEMILMMDELQALVEQEHAVIDPATFQFTTSIKDDLYTFDMKVRTW